MKNLCTSCIFSPYSFAAYVLVLNIVYFDLIKFSGGSSIFLFLYCTYNTSSNASNVRYKINVIHFTPFVPSLLSDAIEPQIPIIARVPIFSGH